MEGDLISVSVISQQLDFHSVLVCDSALLSFTVSSFLVLAVQILTIGELRPKQ
jgi:hypothetical protein